MKTTLILISFFIAKSLFSQCINTYQWPASPVTPTSDWSAIDNENIAGDYAVINVSQGNYYEFSTLEETGSNITYNSSLTLTDMNDAVIEFASYYCYDYYGGAYIVYNATSSGTVKIHLNEGSCGSNSTLSTIMMRVSSSMPTPPSAYPVYWNLLGSEVTLCAGQIDFLVSSSSDGTVQSWTWSGSDGTSGSDNGTSLSFNETITNGPVSYTFIAIDDNGCYGIGDGTIDIVPYLGPVEITIGADVVYASCENATSYSWFNCYETQSCDIGNPIATGASYNPTFTGNTAEWITVCASNQCFEETPDDVGDNCFWVYAGLDYLSEQSLNIFPNPTTNLITIQSENVLNSKFKIYDQQGREVMNGKLSGKETKVSLDKLSLGSYTIQIGESLKPRVIIKQ